MKLLVIVVSYNFCRWIDKCLGSLQKSTMRLDVLVVDNHSSDDTIAIIKECYPWVRLIANEENLGFGAANNIGLKIAVEEGYDGVILLNQDAWIDANVAERLVEAASQYPEYGILSPIHLTGDRRAIEKGFRHTTCIEKPDSHRNKAVVEVSFINAAIWYIPIRVIRGVGMFAPIFYHYGEDVDYVNRIKYHGMKVGYLPGLYGCHDRADRVVTREHRLRDYKVYWLSEYCNLNYCFVKAFAYGVLAGVKAAMCSLFKGNVRDCGAYMGITLWLLGKTREVIVTRKNNR